MPKKKKSKNRSGGGRRGAPGGPGGLLGGMNRPGGMAGLMAQMQQVQQVNYVAQATEMINLEDGTRVDIKEGSSLSYPEAFKGYDPYDTLNSSWPFGIIGKWGPVLAIQFQKRRPA